MVAVDCRRSFNTISCLRRRKALISDHRQYIKQTDLAQTVCCQGSSPVIRDIWEQGLRLPAFWIPLSVVALLTYLSFTLVQLLTNDKNSTSKKQFCMLFLSKLSNVNICCVIMIPVWVEKWKRHKKVTNSPRVHRVYQTKNVRHPFWRRENPSTALTGRKTRAVGSCWRLTSSVVKVLKRARLSIKYGSQFIVATVKYWYLHRVLTTVVILASESP